MVGPAVGPWRFRGDPGPAQLDREASRIVPPAPRLGRFPPFLVPASERCVVMKLSTRLILLVLGCLLPVLTAQVFSQVRLHAERQRQASALEARQAQLGTANLDSVLDGVAQLGASIGHLSSLTAPGERCAFRLNALRQSLPRYQLLAIVSANDGKVLCEAQADGDDWAANPPSWLADLLATTGLTVGKLAADPASRTAFLPVAVRLPPSKGGARLLIAGIGVDWLATRVTSPNPAGLSGDQKSVLAIVDSDGNVVVPDRQSAKWPEHVAPEMLRPLAGRPVPGVATVTDTHGSPFVAAYAPSEAASHRLTAVAVSSLSELHAATDQVIWPDLAVIAGSAIVAILLAWAAGRRFIVQPTEDLLRAAKRWREGNLDARATLATPSLEFASLAQSFNAMAAALQLRENERQTQAHQLEAQVAERTHELSESNNRLQVEIAGREKTEAALHQAQKLQAVGQLAGGIAHDFNNMLATVLGNLELMERRVSQAGERWCQDDLDRLGKLIERATGAVTRGGQLTSRLLAFSRRQRLSARSTDINSLVRELITLATSTLGRRIEVIAELDDSVWPAMVDPSQVEAAVLNLCLNARDAMREGGKLTIRTSNAVVLPGDPGDLAAGNYVRIQVCDTGAGMTPDVRVRAFDPFFTTKEPGAGSGLGLSQVYGMARQSGGGVAIESAPGEGTKVTLFLPRAAEADGPVVVSGQVAPAVTSAMTRELVLVVDDDHAVRQVTVEMTRDLGCEVVQASGGQQALEMLDRMATLPRIFLLDYAMPGMNGLQLARAMRQRGIKAPIALVTGYAELSDADAAAMELSGLLRKPFTIKELQAFLVHLRDQAGTGARQLESTR